MTARDVADAYNLGDDETLIIVESEASAYGNCHWAAYWRTDQKWVPDGVRGQLFYGNLDEHLARDEHFGRKVRVIPFRPSEVQPDLFEVQS